MTWGQLSKLCLIFSFLICKTGMMIISPFGEFWLYYFIVAKSTLYKIYHLNHFHACSSVALSTFTLLHNHPTIHLQNILILPNRNSVPVKH